MPLSAVCMHRGKASPKVCQSALQLWMCWPGVEREVRGEMVMNSITRTWWKVASLGICVGIVWAFVKGGLTMTRQRWKEMEGIQVRGIRLGWPGC